MQKQLVRTHQWIDIQTFTKTLSKSLNEGYALLSHQCVLTKEGICHIAIMVKSVEVEEKDA